MIFSHHSIQALIEYKWEVAKPAIIKWLLLPFLGYLVTFQLYLQYLFTNRLVTMEPDHENFKIYVYSTQGLLLIFAIYLFNQHFKTLRLYDYRFDSTAMLWSMVDLIPLMANCISIIIAIVIEVKSPQIITVCEGDDCLDNQSEDMKKIIEF